MKIIKISLISVLSACIVLYLFVLLFIPRILNSETVKKEAEKLVSSKLGLNLDLNKLSVKSDYKLLYTIKSDQILLINENNEDLLDIKNISVNFFIPLLRLNDLNIDSIFINETGFKNILKTGKKKKTSDFRIKKFPSVNIKKAEIWADNGGANQVFITFNDIRLVNDKDNATYCYFEAEISSNLLKNTITLGREGYIYTDSEALYAKNLQILVGIDSIVVDGKLIDDEKKSDFTIKGKDLPVYDIETSLLYLLKMKKPGKQFLENFKDFGGKMNIDLNIKESGIYGECIAENLNAHTVLFDIPVLFEKALFKFNERTISAEEYGHLGPEKVYTSFKMENIFSPEQIVTGEVKSALSNAIAEKYVPNLVFENIVNASVKYRIKNKKIDVDYIAELKPESDIYFKDAYLGLKKFSRKLYVHTFKEGDNLSITDYYYSFKESDEFKKIILGNGLFKKENGHFRLKTLTFKTNGYAPFSAAGSVSKYVSGGYFNGDLRYDYIDNKVTGNFKVINAGFKDFYVKEAVVNAKQDTLYIDANGLYNNSEFNCDIDAVNNIGNKVVIKKMNLFLDKYIHENKKQREMSKKHFKIPEAAKNLDVTIDNWNIKVNEIRYKRVAAKNILLSGNLRNDIFKFYMPHAYFADGKLWAEGLYNFKDNSSVVDFSAENINSNIVADTVFNLPGQIHGLASAYIHSETKNKFENIKAHAEFFINDGYLLQLGSTEFIIKKSKKIKKPIKFKLKDIVNVDITKAKALSSNIKGSFDLDNYCVSNIYLTSSQKYLSLLIEGNYNIENQNADLRLWGKYNKKAPKGVKVLFIPLSWIINIILKSEETMDLYSDKLKQVPSIVSEKEDEQPFRVKINGKMNDSKNLKVELKSIN